MTIKNDKIEFTIDQYEMSVLGISTVDELGSAMERLIAEETKAKIGFETPKEQE